MLARSIVLSSLLSAPVAAEPYANWGAVKAQAMGRQTIDPPVQPRRIPPDTTRVWISEIDVSDADLVSVRRHVRRNLAKLQDCYVRLRLLPAGSITLELEILPSGGVRTAVARGLDPAVAGCVASAMIRTRFPSANGSSTARIRLWFAP